MQFIAPLIFDAPSKRACQSPGVDAVSLAP
jgi:hypothetical protein